MFVVEKKEETQSAWSSALIGLIVVIWTVLGISAFVMSLLCFGKSGSTSQQIFGFILAVIFGPFYWIYYMVAKKYCR